MTGTQVGIVTTTRKYNNHGELKEHLAEVGGSPVWRALYSRDKLGRITKVTETVQGTTTTREYVYDKNGRLDFVRENGTKRWEYVYDKNGNRTKFRDLARGITETGTYDAQDRTETYDGASYDWTDRGGLRSIAEPAIGTTRFDYDVWGNLREATLPSGQSIEYVVDPRNRRIGKKVGGSFERGWLYDGQLKIVAELDANKTVTSRFVYATESHVPDLTKTSGGIYRYITDPRGSVRLVIDTTTGGVVQKIECSPYGRVLSKKSARRQPFGFAGGLWDRDTGLLRFGARDYDPETGRWTARDPIRFASGDPNLFGYVLRDPVNRVDVSGDSPVSAGIPDGFRKVETVESGLRCTTRSRRSAIRCELVDEKWGGEPILQDLRV